MEGLDYFERRKAKNEMYIDKLYNILKGKPIFDTIFVS
jgi:hypothetical protein